MEPHDQKSPRSVPRLASVNTTTGPNLVLNLFDEEDNVFPGDRKRVINQLIRNHQLPDLLLIGVIGMNVSGIEVCTRVQNTSLFDALPQSSTSNPSNL